MLRNILIGAFFTVLAVMASAGTPAHAGKKEDIALLQQQIAQLQSDLSLLSQRAGRSDACLLYTSPSPRDATLSRMPSSA